MCFIISNLKFEDSIVFNEIHYKGNYIKEEDGKLLLSKSSNIRFRNKFCENLIKEGIEEEIISSDFFIVAEINPLNNMIKIQTDLVSYEGGYFFSDRGYFIFSDNLNMLLKVLNYNNIQIIGLEKKVREFIYFGRYLFGDTIIKNVSLLEPSSLYTLHTKEAKLILEKKFNNFKFNNKISDSKEAADKLFNLIDDLFQNNKVANATYGIGLSGGLDSRVAAFFALKHGYSLQPFFIGAKKNKMGLTTNDAKRSQEVSKELGLYEIEFLNPREYSLEERINNDFNTNLTGSVNIPQNIGLDFISFDYLLHGMIGGEMFGALINKSMEEMNNIELADHILGTFSFLPKYKYKNNVYTKLFSRIPLLKRYILFKKETSREILTEDEYDSIRNKMAQWITKEQNKGLSNINIYMKEFYYRFSPAVKTSYYATLGDAIPSFGVYMNPLVIREILNWNDNMFYNKCVQYELISKLGNLSSIRSQDFRDDFQKNKISAIIYKFFGIMERVIRGGGMVYDDFIDNNELVNYETNLIKESKIYNKLKFHDKSFFNNGLSARLFLIKIAEAENEFKIIFTDE